MSLSLDACAVASLRAQAAAAGITVDALVALAIELRAVEALLERLDAVPAYGTLPTGQSDRPTALPPTGPLRSWVESLDRQAGPQVAAHDNLPQLLLPERLEPRLREIGIDAVISTIEDDYMPLAMQWDAAAACEGQTLTEWLLCCSLSAGERR